MILNSKLHFFLNPQICLHIQGEVHYNTLPIQQFFLKQHIFGKRGNSLSWGINFCKQKLIQASISSNKSFKLRFLKVLVYFPCGAVMLSVHVLSLNNYINSSDFMCLTALLKDKCAILSQNLGKSSYGEKQCLECLWNEIL